MSLRRIVHIDMDAFYASVEQRDHPELRHRPIAVGRSKGRGVVAAASYEARAHGVRSAMASVTARRLCPALIFVRPRFDAYRAASAHIHAIFARYTPLIQPFSLDEAALDVTDHLGADGSATRIAQRIREDIRTETGLTASAGISYNRFLAKLASDQRKPDGLFVIRPQDGEAFVATLPVERFHGIGPATARRMHALGIRVGADLRAAGLACLHEHFGKAAPFYYNIARGIDERPVNPKKIRKSLGTEETYPQDLKTFDACQAALQRLVDKLWYQAVERTLFARTLTLKVKYADFRQITRARTLPLPIASVSTCFETAHRLMTPLFPLRMGLRLLGLTLSGFTAPDEAQLTLALS